VVRELEVLMVIVLCNVPAAAEAGISTALVERGLAACVNAIPGVTSTYVWEGRLCRDPEVTLLIKVAEERVGELAEAIRRLHPYSTPEIVVLPVDSERSDTRYVAWVRAAAPIVKE
jgi:periplasmic divalent cation tolerance protein